ncbi:hypothetical protein DPMN_087328 [Dreissena polymorpha]|uniref:Uncharacterized protein n=1 Tax=Dreissena polymorpha TaxID=45954 RepID=A0A9D4KT05_DREPO|nr:hypothetical protein DPMN_087328 [Dreissena polymorpha]
MVSSVVNVNVLRDIMGPTVEKIYALHPTVHQPAATTVDARSYAETLESVLKASANVLCGKRFSDLKFRIFCTPNSKKRWHYRMFGQEYNYYRMWRADICGF